jgi:hypothetical protein
VHLAAAHAATDHEHRAGMPMVGATVPVLPHHAAELGHRQDHDVVHAIAESVTSAAIDREKSVRRAASCPVDAPWFT